MFKLGFRTGEHYVHTQSRVSFLTQRFWFRRERAHLTPQNTYSAREEDENRRSRRGPPLVATRVYLTAVASGRCRREGVSKSCGERVLFVETLAVCDVKHVPFSSPSMLLLQGQERHLMRLSVPSSWGLCRLCACVCVCCFVLSADHAENEYCSLEGMGHAVKVLAGVIARLEKT